jgi:hypothetical protein
MTLANSARVREGNFALRHSIFTQAYERAPLGPGLHVGVVSPVAEYHGREVLLPVEDIHPKDKSGVLLQDLDLVVSYRVNPARAAEFLVRTNDVAAPRGDPAAVLGRARVERAARQMIGPALRAFDSLELLGDPMPLERAFARDLQGELDREYGAGTLAVIDVKVANLRVAELVEQRVQSIALVEAERARNESTQAVLESRRHLLEAEGRMHARAAAEAGVTVPQLLRWESIRHLREQAPGRH